MAPQSPVSETAPIGREGELLELSRALEEHALVVIKGPPGIGKTRLARHWTKSLTDDERPSGGVWLVDLLSCRSLGDVFAAIARDLGISLAASDSDTGLQSALTRALEERGELLMLLDNFEQLPSEADQLVVELAEAVPELSLLITSRRRIVAPHAYELALGPLALPDAERSGAAVADAAAVRLFLQHAHWQAADLTREQFDTVARIVRDLSGVPLAIELGAARTRMLSLEQIEAKLGDRLELLRQSSRSGDPRHAALKTALGWSFQLLSEEQRTLLCLCGSFLGSFSLDDAEELVRQSGQELPVLDLLESLEAVSLLSVVDTGDQALRYELGPSTRAFVRDVGENLGDAAHASVFHARALEWAQADRRGQPASRKLRQQLSDLLLAFETLVHRADAPSRERALELVVALQPVLLRHGPVHRYAKLLEQALEALPNDVPAAAQVRARSLLGWVHLILGRQREALEQLSAAAARAEAEGLTELTVETRSRAAVVALLAGLSERSEAELARARTLVDRRAGSEGRIEYFRCAGICATQAGRPEEARQLLLTGLSDAVQSGARLAEGMLASNLLDVCLELGRLDEAFSFAERALSSFRIAEDRRREGQLRATVAAGLLERGELERALSEIDAALALHREVANRFFESYTLVYRGHALLESGRPREARLEYLRALELTAPSRSSGLIHVALALCDLVTGHSPREHLAPAQELLAQHGNQADRGLVAHVGALIAAWQDESALANWHGELSQLALSSWELRQLPRVARRYVGIEAGGEPRRGTLQVASDGRWFVSPSGERVEFRRQRAMRAMLLCLVRARLESPGVAVDGETLKRAGWPDERILREAAMNRIYVNISNLRRRGLRELLVSRDDGWLLDPAFDAEIVPE